MMESKKQQQMKREEIILDFLENLADNFEKHSAEESVEDANRIVGVDLTTGDEACSENPNDYCSRKVFSVEEGNYLTFLVKTNLGFDGWANRWDEKAVVRIEVNDSLYIEEEGEWTPNFWDDEQYFIFFREMDWAEIMDGERTKIKVRLTIGLDEIPFESDFYVDIIPGEVSEDIEMVDMNLTTKYNEMRYGFGEDEKENANLCITCKNTFPDWVVDNCLAEAEVRFYNEQDSLIHQFVTQGFTVDEEKEVIFLDDFSMSGWRNDLYMIKVYIWGMEVASSIFYVGSSMEGHITMHDYTKDRKKNKKEQTKDTEEKKVAEVSAIEQIQRMIGLTEVKKMLAQNIHYVKLMEERKKVGLPAGNRLMHVVMSGAPGTGKTTVARLLGAAYKEMGILSKGHTVECNRSTLISDHIGGTEKATQEKMVEAKGGVLFIDEAYSLLAESPTSNDFGCRIIDTLMTMLSDPDADMLVVIAGYKDEMQKLLDCNPGLASRFPVRLHFPDYSVDELLLMVSSYFNTYQYDAEEEVMARIRKVIERAVKVKSFGEGRFVKTFIENTILPNMATRLFKEGGNVNVNSLTRIDPQDIPEPEEVIAQMNTVERKVRAIGFR